MRLGADPEVFLVNPKTNKHMSAIGLINADKWNPLQIADMPKGFTLQEDNVALEYGIPPAANADEFVRHIQLVMEKSKEWTKGLAFSKLSCTIFERDQMEHPLAHVFGCEPDYNAWTGRENVKPQPPHPLMRSAGGHIHVETKQDPKDVVKKMDLCLAIPSLIMDEQGSPRRQLYGNIGAHRVKSYGPEYRVLSNFWIFDENKIRWVWNATKRALDMDVKEVEAVGDMINVAVNNNDKDMAWGLIDQFNLELA
jgi:hypothetical protein